jgi:hypothetical protein
MSEPDAKALVDRYAKQIIAELGAEPARTALNVAACRGKNDEVAADGRFDIQANYQIPLTEGTHRATLGRLRDEWVKQGYELNDNRTFKEDEITVDVRNPTDGIQISLTSTRPATAVAVTIITPCYTPPKVS